MESMVGHFASLLADSLNISLNGTDGNVSSLKVTDDLLPNQTFDLYWEENMTSGGSESQLVEVAELLNSSEKELLDCGTMPDIVRVKVC